MKLFTGWVMSAGLVLSAVAANAQGAAPAEAGRPLYTAVSDFGGPYAAMPPQVPAPGYGPVLLPPREVYTVVRESGFSPLGIPRQRGMFYVISVVDRRGDDGRLVIDARDGQIVRFVPAYRMGVNFNEDVVPRPPASVPKLASRMPATVPLPKASPQRTDEVKPLAEKPAAAPKQQSAAVQTRPADAPATPQAAAPVVEAKPAAPAIQPTQPMPKVQGLE